ncbi:MAG: LamG domain-containing protein, partial [Phycisphaerales bacterium]
MLTKSLLVTSFVAVLGFAMAGAAQDDPNLVGWWKCDDGSGNTAADSSGLGNNGNLVNNPQWVAGYDGGGLRFNGSSSYVDCGNPAAFDITGQVTLALWVKTEDAANGQHNPYVGKGDTSYAIKHHTSNSIEFFIYDDTWYTARASLDSSFNGVWHHVAGTYDGANLKVYVDGALQATTAYVGSIASSTYAVNIARNSQVTGRFYAGAVDDVRIYDRALTDAEVAALIPPKLKAYDPAPADGAESVGRYENYGLLSWKAGDTAAWHRIYYGANPVLGAADFKQRSPLASVYYFPIDRVAGTTYYWRIDEEESGGAIITGDTWWFTTAPLEAHNPDPADKAQFVDPNKDLAWSAGFDATSHDVYFGTDATAVANATVGTAGIFKGNQMEATFEPGVLAKGTTYYWRIDERDAANTYKGDVWSLTTLPVIPLADPNLVGWWKLDEGQGDTVIDWSGRDNHGTLFGDPEWVVGYDGEALDFDGVDDWVQVPHSPILTVDNEVTVMAWINAQRHAGPGGAGWQGILAKGNSPRSYSLYTTSGGLLHFSTAGVGSTSSTQVPLNEWVHVAAMVSGGSHLYYINGQPAGGGGSGIVLPGGSDAAGVLIGRTWETSREFLGMIDDARIYNKALTPEEIKQAMRGDPRLAWNPYPENGSTVDIKFATPLTWSAGEIAQQHHVYFGADRDAVENADTSTAGIYRGTQTFTTYNPPQALAFGTTYYWRIDEQNNDGTTTKGRLWRFAVADYLVVDDFEDYNDYAPDRIFEWWLDGFGYGAPPPSPPPYYPGNGTGSIVGYAVDPFAETNIVHGGDQAMPYFFNNDLGTLKYSEATRRLIYPRNWTEEGVKALSLWYRGYPASEGGYDYNMATGTFTVRGAGTDIWNVSDPRQAGSHDEFHFVYQTLTGAGSIQARVESVQNTNGWAKAGVMIRDTLDANSVHSMVIVTPSQGVAWQYRMDTGGASTNNQVTGISAPQWVRITRAVTGEVTAEYSDDAITWTRIGDPLNIPMNTPMYIGLCLTSHSAFVTCEAVFSNVSFPTGTPSGSWKSQDIGIISNDPEKMYVAISNSNGTTGVVYHPDQDAILTTSWTEWNIPLTEFSNQGVVLTD